jgi:hypothetical protein
MAKIVVIHAIKIVKVIQRMSQDLFSLLNVAVCGS